MYDNSFIKQIQRLLKDCIKANFFLWLYLNYSRNAQGKKLKHNKNQPQQLDLVRIPETKKDSLLLFLRSDTLERKVYIQNAILLRRNSVPWCHRQTILDLSVKKWRAPDSLNFSFPSLYTQIAYNMFH